MYICIGTRQSGAFSRFRAVLLVSADTTLVLAQQDQRTLEAESHPLGVSRTASSLSLTVHMYSLL